MAAREWKRDRAGRTLRAAARGWLAAREWKRLRENMAAHRLQVAVRRALQQRKYADTLRMLTLQGAFRRAVRQREWELSRAALILKRAASRALRQRGWRSVGRIVAAARCRLAQLRLVSELTALREEEAAVADSLAKTRALRGRGAFPEHFRGLRPLLEQLEAPALARTLNELGALREGLDEARRAEARLAEEQKKVQSEVGKEEVERLLPRRDAVLPRPPNDVSPLRTVREIQCFKGALLIKVNRPFRTLQTLLIHRALHPFAGTPSTHPPALVTAAWLHAEVTSPPLLAHLPLPIYNASIEAGVSPSRSLYLYLALSVARARSLSLPPSLARFISFTLSLSHTHTHVKEREP
jgi:hypothetical protein